MVQLMTLSLEVAVGVADTLPQPAPATTAIDTPQMTNQILLLLTDLVRIVFSPQR